MMHVSIWSSDRPIYTTWVSDLDRSLRARDMIHHNHGKAAPPTGAQLAANKIGVLKVASIPRPDPRQL